jgi:hypothetical protein
MAGIAAAARTCCCRGYLAFEAGALDAVDGLSLA